MISRRLLLACATLFLTACLNDPIEGSATTTGLYTLRSVNGAGLPATIEGTGPNRTEIVDASYRLQTGFTYTGTETRRVYVNGTPTTETLALVGTYAFFGTSITLTRTTPVGPETRQGVVSANQLTFTADGLSMVFRR